MTGRGLCEAEARMVAAMLEQDRAREAREAGVVARSRARLARATSRRDEGSAWLLLLAALPCTLLAVVVVARVLGAAAALAGSLS